MTINPKISAALDKYCESDEKHLKEFLKELLIIELGKPGWYKDAYKELINKFCIGENENEN